ncbi:MAG: acylneuraminate cytidylyltransferase [uncultured bacterium (gcode 4)]|uniref:N-acylneuraminate cytidylyltransferase n=1 Tax=uncultured bacterium (gcode 4) TaxID=1234023 RepID=K1YCD4_9BACT|nr:MAG: acylneuraminate cytidylyltransferase [uncultured bacterium (gcode 4)]
MKIIALIPLRGGSKSIPHKNIKLLAWKPLCNWTIEASLWSKYIQETWVSTDDQEIKAIAIATGAKVIDRPTEFASDTASTESVMLHFMKHIDFDILVTLQATSPCTSSDDLDTAIKQFIDKEYGSMLSWVITKRFFWNKNGQPLNYDYLSRPRRQDFEGTIMENGAFYITKKSVLQKNQNRLGGKIGIYKMSEDTAIEIDEPEDWVNVEKILLSRQKDTLIDIKNIKVIFSDFDGVWTNNMVYTDSIGNEILRCSKADSLWLNIFRENIDIPIIVLTKEANPVVKKRCEKLKICVEDNMINKESFIEKYIKTNKISWENVCYVWNDINDLYCIQKAWLSFCPKDAVKLVKDKSLYILNAEWWNGAIREIFDIFLMQK